jgi:hypothetical protein
MTDRAGKAYYRIDHVEGYAPFLVSLVSPKDHWCFIASNGGMTAGRRSPTEALFPYYTQDKLIDFADVSGPFTAIQIRRPGKPKPTLWRALDPRSRKASRSLEKSLDGTRLVFTETCPTHPLTLEVSWGTSARFGFVRQVTLRSTADESLDLSILDGWRNLQATGVSDAFQNEFSNLVDAYRCSEAIDGTTLRLTYLNSAPTDRAEPSESLQCTVAWSILPTAGTPLVSERQLKGFLDGGAVEAEHYARGLRAAALDQFEVTLGAGETVAWTTVADVAQTTAQADRLRAWLTTTPASEQEAELNAELDRAGEAMARLVASADGLSLTADRLRGGRHFSNVMFNLMRGGVFLQQGNISREQLAEHLARFNRPLAVQWAEWLGALPSPITPEDLAAKASETGDPDLQRLVRECLPLTFSRRHGDPSRPWNRFAIRVEDKQGRPLLGYQGNWRDIFQNWEALLHAFPEHFEGVIFRFLNATSADGYNPYRLTHEGFEWESPEPHSPWSNIGYWGDHQIIYLLRLLEGSQRFHPDALNRLLAADLFVFADIPYRIRSYSDMLGDPRQTIDFDRDREELIEQRVATEGADGRLLRDATGSIAKVNLFEKLLQPLVAKLAAFVPAGGIWMNTQRPEWNDANNALVGYGVSVVTLGYCHRYLQFLVQWWESLPASTLSLSVELVELLQAQSAIFATLAEEDGTSDAARAKVMAELGAAVSAYRETLYTRSLSGKRTPLALDEVLTYLRRARKAVATSLRANRRSDGLYHSYNLLHWENPQADRIALRHLDVMLEGQVSILSAELLAPAEAAEVCQALRESPLYRADQDSYLLYPDREVDRFLQKNQLRAEFVAASPVVGALLADETQNILERDARGAVRFGGSFRNAEELRAALARLPERLRETVQGSGEDLVRHFEEIFQHHAFTGRSGSFFAYEGLGSIYWHMVSKLVLAIQENALAAIAHGADEAVTQSLVQAYRDTLEGLGIHKAPSLYGAFPTDAYSHTPKHAGAQQPGMTGQVKEDVLIRWGELGVHVVGGQLHFEPSLLHPAELLSTSEKFHYYNMWGEASEQVIPADGLAFTFCGVPVIYRRSDSTGLQVVHRDGRTTVLARPALPQEISASIFQRRGEIELLEVRFGPEYSALSQ